MDSRTIPGITAARSTRGFTLVELLVVLLIMGLLIGLASTIVRPNDGALLRVEAERLAQLLDLAAQESRLAGKTIAWTADGAGYRFWQMTDDAEWSQVLDSDLLRARTLPSGMLISGLQIEDMPVTGAMRLEFAPDGTTPSFTVGMSLGAVRYAVEVSPVGEVRVLPGDGDAHGALAQQ